MTRTLVRAALPALLALGCAGAEPAAPEGDAALNAPVIRTAPGGLRQTVTLSVPRPRIGESFTIRSAVVNTGPSAVPLTSRICGLDLRADVEISPVGLMCGGYSREGALAPGDSVVSFQPVVVRASRADSYTVRVRHMLEPEQWVDVVVRISK